MKLNGRCPGLDVKRVRYNQVIAIMNLEGRREEHVTLTTHTTGVSLRLVSVAPLSHQLSKWAELSSISPWCLTGVIKAIEMTAGDDKLPACHPYQWTSSLYACPRGPRVRTAIACR